MSDLFFNELLEKVKQKLADPGEVQDGEIWKTMLTEAIDRYSRHKPDEKVSDIAGTGTFKLTLPSDYIDGFSSVVRVEYPFTEAQQTPVILRGGRDYAVYRNATGLELRFLAATPASGETVRFTYSTVHVVDITTTTIPDVDEQAVINLGASLMATALEAEFTKRARSTMPDTTFDLRSKAQEYRDLAKDYMKIWMDMMGIDENGGPAAAVAVADYDMKLTGGRAPLTHPVHQQG